MSHGGAEDCHHIVADMLVDDATVGFDDVVHSLKVEIEERTTLFSTEVVRQCGEFRRSANSTVT